MIIYPHVADESRLCGYGCEETGNDINAKMEERDRRTFP